VFWDHTPLVRPILEYGAVFWYHTALVRPILEYGAVYWDHTALVRPILEYGAVYWDQTALLRPILEYGAVCWDPYRDGQVSALNRVQKRADKFANNINGSGWETLAQRRLLARICALFKSYTEERA
jgi:hypothetical protein